MASAICITCKSGWTSADLLTRANNYLRARSRPELTGPTLRKWVRAGLVPPPTRRGRGQGRGAAQDWSALAYRRVLQAAAVRDMGMVRHDEQRLALWLGGGAYSLGSIRSDLATVYARQIAEANRQARTERWGSQSAGMTLKALHLALAGLDIRPDLATVITPFAGALRAVGIDVSGVLTSDRLERLAGVLAWRLLVTGEEAGRWTLRDIGSGAPPIVGDVLSSEGETLEAMTGLLASPEEFDNPLLLAVANASDEMLTNLRDWVSTLDEFADGFLAFAAAVVRDDPTVLSTFEPLQPLVIGFLNDLRPRIRSSTPSTKLTALALFLRLSVKRGDEAAAFGVAGRVHLGRLFNWYAAHWQDAKNLSERDVLRLMHASNIPAATIAWVENLTGARVTG